MRAAWRLTLSGYWSWWPIPSQGDSNNNQLIILSTLLRATLTAEIPQTVITAFRGWRMRVRELFTGFRDCRAEITGDWGFDVGRVLRVCRVDAFRTKGHEFDSRSSWHVGTLGKYFTRSCLWHFCVKFRHSIRAVSGAPLISSGLEEALYKWSEWMNGCVTLEDVRHSCYWSNQLSYELSALRFKCEFHTRCRAQAET